MLENIAGEACCFKNNGVVDMNEIEGAKDVEEAKKGIKRRQFVKETWSTITSGGLRPQGRMADDGGRDPFALSLFLLRNQHLLSS